MWNIIKAQLYQLRRTRLAGIGFLVSLFLIAVPVVSDIWYQDAKDWTGKPYTGSCYITDYGATSAVIALLFIGVITGIVMGKDFHDQTVNYELMTGHIRKEVFGGRVLLAICIGISGGIILMLIPVVVLSLILGWGTYITVSQYALRLLLVIFPFFRIICEMIFFTVILKNPYIVMGGTFYISMGLSDYFPPSTLLGISNLNLIFNLNTWEVDTMGEKRYLMVDAALNGADVVKTVAVSVLIGVFFLMLAYRYLHHDDLN